jgi:excisionase family DNA binding protein
MKQTPIQPRLLRTKQAAIYLGCSPCTIRRLAQNGAFPYIPEGSAWRFDRADLDRYIETAKTEGD